LILNLRSWLPVCTSVADPDPFDTDPDYVFHFDTAPDHAFQYDTDTDTDTDPDPDPYRFKEVM
jgi:hypothetical protein